MLVSFGRSGNRSRKRVQGLTDSLIHREPKGCALGSCSNSGHTVSTTGTNPCFHGDPSLVGMGVGTGMETDHTADGMKKEITCFIRYKA